MRSGLEIQEALRKFVAKCSGYGGTERAEIQTFPELVRRLTELNRKIVEGGLPYNPFGQPDG